MTRSAHSSGASSSTNGAASQRGGALCQLRRTHAIRGFRNPYIGITTRIPSTFLFFLIVDLSDHLSQTIRPPTRTLPRPRSYILRFNRAHFLPNLPGKYLSASRLTSDLSSHGVTGNFIPRINRSRVCISRDGLASCAHVTSERGQRCQRIEFQMICERYISASVKC